MTDPQQVRVRFAPSPTGHLHVGGLRTALYNYLFARHHGGSFILRIEDTDRARYVPGATEKLIDTLNWAGLDYDEGPAKGGSYGPYVQSERLAIYRAHADQLLAKDQAYRCFCTAERLDEMRKKQEREKSPFKYDRTCLHLDRTQIDENMRAGRPFVVRMKVPSEGAIRFSDEIRGDVQFVADQIDDQVLLKSDGYPTYHLANVVDDHLMEVTHVIRGEEWLSSMPKHVILYRFFGWKTPVFAHLPLLLNPDRSKLSKRQGDVAVEDYRDKGYLREALLNFIAFLGWNPGGEQELFTLDELVRQFSLSGVNKSGAIFNLEKLNWLNFEHLRRMPEGTVLAMLKEELAKSPFAGRTYPDGYLLKVISSMRERVGFIGDFIGKSPYFFGPPAAYDPAVVKKRWTKESVRAMQILADEFSRLDAPSRNVYEETLHRVAASLGVSNGELIHPLRLALSGVGGGPGVYDIVEILGRDETVKRLRTAITSIPIPS